MSQTRPKITAIGRLNVFGESAFGDDASANGKYLRSLLVDPSSLTVNAIADEHMRHIDTETARIIGAYRGTVTTTHYMHGFSSSIPSSTSPLKEATDNTGTAWDQLAAILASALGNYKGGGYLDGIAGGDLLSVGSTGLSVADASGGLDDFGVGEPICWATGDTQFSHEVAWIQDLDTSGDPAVATFLQDTPVFSPQGDTLWGGAPVLWVPSTAEMDPYHNNASNTGVSNGADPVVKLNSPAASWTLEMLGADLEQHLKCYGCQPIGLKRTFTIGELSTIEITWGVSHWEALGSGDSPSQGTYIFPDPEMVAGGWVAWGSSKSDGNAGGSLLLKNLEVDIGIQRNAIMDASQPSGVGGWFTAKRTPTVTFQVYRDYSKEITDFEDQNGKPFTFQFGSQPGKIFACCIPNARIPEWPQQTDDEGAVMSQVTLEAHNYTSDTGDPTVSADEITPVNSRYREAYL